jgi:DNA-binding transcriptional ArsR family regulator
MGLCIRSGWPDAGWQHGLERCSAARIAGYTRRHRPANYAIAAPDTQIQKSHTDFRSDDNAHGGNAVTTALSPSPLYTFTSICSVEYIKRMESVFEIIAEPNRRAILSLLVSSQQSVGEIERQLRMPQPTVSKHLPVLREPGFVESTVDAQRRLYRLKPEPFQEVDAWLAPFRRFWSAHVDALERHLDRMDRSTPTKRKTRKRR